MNKEKKKWQTPEVSYMEAGEAVMLTESLMQGDALPGEGVLEGKLSSFSSMIHDYFTEEIRNY